MGNPFTNYSITIPSAYSESIKNFCNQSNPKQLGTYVPFNRQVDFWYFSFLYAVKENLEPEHISSSLTQNITQGSILTDEQVHLMQMVYLANTLDIDSLKDSRTIFNYVSDMAFAGMTHVIALLKDEDEETPLDGLFTYIESRLK